MNLQSNCTLLLTQSCIIGFFSCLKKKVNNCLTKSPVSFNVKKINELWTRGISFHKKFHLYKITTFSAGAGNKQRHIHIFYHRLLMFAQTTFIFVTMPL